MPKIITSEELQAREIRIIETACELIQQQGFAAITMDKIVAKVPYSKGSVYKHFNSIEELMLAITNSGAYHLLAFMERAKLFSGSTRERYLARALAYFVYGQLYPIQFFCELEAMTPLVREKASARHTEEGKRLLQSFYSLAAEFVADGVKEGDLVLSADATPQRIANISWTSEFGLASYTLAVSFGNAAHKKQQAKRLEEELFWMVNVFMDGLAWRPLTSEHNYRDTWARIKEEVFAEEVGKLLEEEERL